MNRSPTAVHQAVSTPASSPLQLTPSQLDDLVTLKLRDVCSGISDWKLPLTVVGTLGDLPTSRYGGGRLYKVPLVDAAAPASVTYLNLRETTLEQAEAGPGDVVRVTGMIVPELFKGTVSFRLEVVALEHEVPAAVPQVREGVATLDTLRRLATTRRPFPPTAQPSITLIHSAASEARVAEDFAGALAPDQAATIRRVPVSMHDPAAIAAALRGARTEIVALVRGGGDAASFAVFEDPRVLEALAACPAYRILGLGHTANRTLAEVLADHAASTPAAAGEHVRRGTVEAGKLVRTSGQLRELREALAAKELELARERQMVRLEEPEGQEVTEETFRAIDRRLAVPAWVWVAVGAVVAWGVGRWL